MPGRSSGRSSFHEGGIHIGEARSDWQERERNGEGRVRDDHAPHTERKADQDKEYQHGNGNDDLRQYERQGDHLLERRAAPKLALRETDCGHRRDRGADGRRGRSDRERIADGPQHVIVASTTAYQRKPKPDQIVRESPSLNDITTKVTIGM